METEIIKLVGQVAGIGGIALGIFLLLYREIIRKNIFPSLTKQQAYSTIKLLLILTFFITLFGISAWVYSLRIQNSREELPLWSGLEYEYYQPFDATYENPDELKDIYGEWNVFESDLVWTVSINDGAYCFSNSSSKQAAHYQYIGLTEKDVSNLPVSVDIKSDSVKNTRLSSAGLLYRFNRKTKFYYAFTISTDGLLYFYKRNATGYNTLYSGQGKSFLTTGANRLAIIAKNNVFYLFFNQDLVKIVKDNELLSGDTGVIALSTGSFCFDNFSIYRKIERTL